MYTKTNQPSICFLQSALHIADKFHLIKNISERFTKLIGENYSDYRNAIRESQAIREELKNNELDLRFMNTSSIWVMVIKVTDPKIIYQ